MTDSSLQLEEVSIFILLASTKKAVFRLLVSGLPLSSVPASSSMFMHPCCNRFACERSSAISSVPAVIPVMAGPTAGGVKHLVGFKVDSLPFWGGPPLG